MADISPGLFVNANVIPAANAQRQLRARRVYDPRGVFHHPAIAYTDREETPARFANKSKFPPPHIKTQRKHARLPGNNASTTRRGTRAENISLS